MKALVIIKPDGLYHTDYILKKLRKNDISILAMKTMNISADQARQLYHMHQQDYFYSTLVNYMQTGTAIVVAVDADLAVLKNIKREVREQVKNQEKIEVNQIIKYHSTIDQQQQPIFINEYFNTFDAMHCSDPGDGEHEVNLFFSPAELQFKPFAIPDALPLIEQKLIDRAEAETAKSTKQSIAILVKQLGLLQFQENATAPTAEIPQSTSAALETSGVQLNQ